MCLVIGVRRRISIMAPGSMCRLRSGIVLGLAPLWLTGDSLKKPKCQPVHGHSTKVYKLSSRAVDQLGMIGVTAGGNALR
jgi:hypothetical protein